MITHRSACGPHVSVRSVYREGLGEECFDWKGVDELPLKKLECLTPVPMRLAPDIKWRTVCDYTVLTAREGEKSDESACRTNWKLQGD
jgi:hypothetical protein